MGDSELISACRGTTPRRLSKSAWGYFAPRAKRRESVAALLARSLRLEPSSFRTACCSPVLVEVEVHQGVVKPGSLLQQVDEKVAAYASSAAAAAAPVMEELQLLRPRRLVLRRRRLRRRPPRLEQAAAGSPCWRE